MSKELDPEIDNTIDTSDLSTEFKNLPPTMYGYRVELASAEHGYDLAKATYEELRSAKYLEIRSREGKVTEATVEATLDIDPEIKAAKRKMLEAKRDMETVDGFMESLRAKKDMLIQLGADARKEQ